MCGGINERLKISLIKLEKDGKATQSQISDNPHEGSILAMDMSPSLSGHLCTTGSRGNIYVWKIPENFS